MPRTALRLAAVAAALSALTTFLLWLLPRLTVAPATFDETIALHANPLYLGRLWVNFIHIFFALSAYAGATWLLWRRSPALAGAGFISMFMWALTELLGVSVNLFAVNATWRAQFAISAPAVQDQLRILLLGFQGVWDGMFFLLLVCFLLGSLCYGLALVRQQKVERTLGWLFLLAVPLTVAIMLGGYTSISNFDGIVGMVYPVLQPVSRLLLAVWLWRQATSDGESQKPA
ncbi:hypothetical protein [Massilia sp. CF038]|uniref:hypothetical protein n=1 Tax=Massilia sp. CF038 TaxID=1881045 RepID=UPI00091509F0|nr:hypothetical protein [Massilia sp. CF038]SHG35267.1 hypothetical protein SAMN05428948_0038 [Massilia sp. CF038]